MIPEDTTPVETRRSACAFGGWRDGYGISGKACKTRLRLGQGTMEKCKFEANFLFARRPLSVRPGLGELQRIRLMLRGGNNSPGGCM